MPYTLSDKLVIGISSRALFDLEHENEIWAPRKTSFPENPAYKNQRLTEPILQKSGVFRGAHL